MKKKIYKQIEQLSIILRFFSIKMTFDQVAIYLSKKLGISLPGGRGMSTRIKWAFKKCNNSFVSDCIARSFTCKDGTYAY